MKLGSVLTLFLPFSGGVAIYADEKPIVRRAVRVAEGSVKRSPTVSSTVVRRGAKGSDDTLTRQ